MQSWTNPSRARAEGPLSRELDAFEIAPEPRPCGGIQKSEQHAAFRRSEAATALQAPPQDGTSGRSSQGPVSLEKGREYRWIYILTHRDSSTPPERSRLRCAVFASTACPVGGFSRKRLRFPKRPDGKSNPSGFRRSRTRIRRCCVLPGRTRSRSGESARPGAGTCPRSRAPGSAPAPARPASRPRP